MAVAPPALADALRDRYVLERELGHGGMATVYLARDLKHDRPVALKVLRPELAASLGPERFQREIELAARLRLANALRCGLEDRLSESIIWEPPCPRPSPHLWSCRLSCPA